MTEQLLLPQLLRRLAIQGGNHWVTLNYEGDEWRFPVSEGRVGPLQGAGRAEEDLPTLVALGVELKVAARPGKAPPPDARWPLAARLARVLDDTRSVQESQQKTLNENVAKPVSVVEQMDGLLNFAESLELIANTEQLVDKTVEYLSKVRPMPALVSRLEPGIWIGPRGRIEGRIDGIEEASSRGLLVLRRAIGESYERHLTNTDFDRVAILPLAEDLVVLVPCHGVNLEERPRDLRILLSLYRSASSWLENP
ncbi:MAG TPA: hypothetical protein DEB46_10755 [Myxococcales bacterium]|nr:hypothetical protein [Myxococcales bacterium]|tara:strand:+ start:49 stop:807 length:759 start_codon:yes stop_codon:yes gene_type:complete